MFQELLEDVNGVLIVAIRASSRRDAPPVLRLTYSSMETNTNWITRLSNKPTAYLAKLMSQHHTTFRPQSSLTFRSHNPLKPYSKGLSTRSEMELTDSNVIFGQAKSCGSSNNLPGRRFALAGDLIR